MKNKHLYVIIYSYLLFCNTIKVNSSLDAVFNTINQTKGYVFSQLRYAKLMFPKDIHYLFENNIKEYEYRYLQGDEIFNNYVRLMYDSYKEFQNHKYSTSIKNELESYIHNLMDIINNIKEHQFKKLLLVEAFKLYGKESFYFNILVKVFEQLGHYNNDNFKGIDSIIHNLVSYLSSGKNIKEDLLQDSKAKNINSLEDLYIDKPNKNNLIEEKEINLDILQLKILNKSNSNDMPESFKIDSNFNEFINEMHEKYNLKDAFNNKAEYHYNKNKTNIENLENVISDEDNDKFNLLLHKYLHKAIISNDEFKEVYTKNKKDNLDLMNLRQVYTEDVLDKKMKELYTKKLQNYNNKYKSKDLNKSLSIKRFKLNKFKNENVIGANGIFKKIQHTKNNFSSFLEFNNNYYSNEEFRKQNQILKNSQSLQFKSIDSKTNLEINPYPYNILIEQKESFIMNSTKGGWFKRPSNNNNISNYPINIYSTKANMLTGLDTLKNSSIEENKSKANIVENIKNNIPYSISEENKRKMSNLDINNGDSSSYKRPSINGRISPSTDIDSEDNKNEAINKDIINKVKEATTDIMILANNDLSNIAERNNRLRIENIDKHKEVAAINKVMEKIENDETYKASKKIEKKEKTKFLLPWLLKPIMNILELLGKTFASKVKSMTDLPVKDSIKKVMLKNSIERLYDDERQHNEDLKCIDCQEQDKKLDLIIKNQLSKLEDDNLKAKKALSEVDPIFLNNIGDENNSKNLFLNILQTFLKKLIVIVITHLPFYFFKICIPLGPLTFGCCPEAGFFPQQLYHIFTVFDKVEKFKTVAQAYPSWLNIIGREDFSEMRYYTCAQSYLTLTESSIFNFCFPPSMVWIHPMNLAGLIPGDLPLCFWACLQTMIMCGVWISKIAECDALINLRVIIKAMFVIPNRTSLMMIFNLCTYIPFLIRWDLVPKWTRPDVLPNYKKNLDLPSKNNIKPDNPNNLDSNLNCADPDINPSINDRVRKGKALGINATPIQINNLSDNAKRNMYIQDSIDAEEIESPFEKELRKIDKENASNFINKAKKEVELKENIISENNNNLRNYNNIKNNFKIIIEYNNEVKKRYIIGCKYLNKNNRKKVDISWQDVIYNNKINNNLRNNDKNNKSNVNNNNEDPNLISEDDLIFYGKHDDDENIINSTYNKSDKYFSSSEIQNYSRDKNTYYYTYVERFGFDKKERLKEKLFPFNMLRIVAKGYEIARSITGH